MAVTPAELTKRALKWLDDEPAEYSHSNSMTSAVSDKTVTVTDGTKFAVGLVLEWRDDSTFERVLIESISSNTLTVKRGHDHTTAAAHAAAAKFVKQPDWNASLVNEAVLRTIDADLYPYVWKKKTLQVTPDPATKTWYDLAADALGLIQVTQPFQSNRNIYKYGVKGSAPVQFERNLPVAVCASGVGISFPSGFNVGDTNVQVDYASLITSADVEEGLMADVVVAGTLKRVISSRDIRRLSEDTQQGDVANRPGSAIRNAAWFAAQFESLRWSLNIKLKQEIPIAPVYRR